jgi:hypothetical protein
MKTGIIAAALIVVFAIPTLAGSGAYYIGLRLGSVSCTIMTHEPSPTLGKFMTRADARKALTEMAECH